MSFKEVVVCMMWECDYCHTTQYTRSVIVEVTPQRRAELEESGITDPALLRTGSLYNSPETVSCCHCGEKEDSSHWLQGAEDN